MTPKKMQVLSVVSQKNKYKNYSKEMRRRSLVFWEKKKMGMDNSGLRKEEGKDIIKPLKITRKQRENKK